MMRLFFIVECRIARFLCAMGVFGLRSLGIILILRLPFCQMLLLLRPPLLS